MVSLDFQQKCIDGDLEEVKSIVNRYALHALIIYQGAYRACQYDHLHIVQYLIEKVTMPNGKNEDFFIRDCITYTKNLEILKYFIHQKDANTHMVADHVCSIGHIEAVKYMTDVLKLNLTKSIRWACANDHLEIVKYLYNRIINDDYNFSIDLQYASIRGNLNIVKYLLEEHDDLDSNNLSFCLACTHGRIHIVKYMLNNATLNVSAFDNRAIYRADIGKYFDIVKIILESSTYSGTYILSEECKKYLNYYEKRRTRLAKKIYFWWIQLCYDIKNHCGQRMIQKNYDEYKKKCQA